MASSAAAQTTKYNYWLENLGQLQVVFDGIDSSRFICGDFKPKQRLRVKSVVNGYYQLLMEKGDCKEGLGYVSKEGPFQLLRSPIMPTQPLTKPVEPKALAPVTVAPIATPSTDAVNRWKSHWDLEPRGYLALGVASFWGVAAFEESGFGLAIEPGWIPTLSKLFSLGFPIRYYTPSAIDIGDDIVLDVHLLQVGVRPQYRIGFGESPHFISLATDLGVAVAYGEFSATIDEVTDYSLWVRPTLGYGYQTLGGRSAYLLELGSSVMPLGYGLLGANIDAAFSIQYLF